MRSPRAVAALLCATIVAGAHAASAAGTCAGFRDLIGACFPVHGRAAVYNGSPTVRIWRIGTRRLLGVSDSRCQPPDCRQMPDDLRARLGWDRPVFGDFVVCPFTRARPGVMQMVCVESAHRLRSH